MTEADIASVVSTWTGIAVEQVFFFWGALGLVGRIGWVNVFCLVYQCNQCSLFKKLGFAANLIALEKILF